MCHSILQRTLGEALVAGKVFCADTPIVSGAAFRVIMATKIVVLAIDGHDGESGRFVQTERWDASRWNRHGALTPWELKTGKLPVVGY